MPPQTIRCETCEYDKVSINQKHCASCFYYNNWSPLEGKECATCKHRNSNDPDVFIGKCDPCMFTGELDYWELDEVLITSETEQKFEVPY